MLSIFSINAIFKLLQNIYSMYFTGLKKRQFTFGDIGGLWLLDTLSNFIIFSSVILMFNWHIIQYEIEY